MERKDLDELKLEEVGNKLQEDVNAFKEELSSIKEDEVLKKKEEGVLERMKIYEEYLKTVKYKLPEDVEFDGKKYPKSVVFSAIIYFLDKMEVDFSFATGLYQMSKLWRDQNMEEIDYYKFDSSLRTLGQMKFRGYREWKDISVVNTYMSKLHEQYGKDLTYFTYLSHLHNAILDRMQLITGIDPVEEKCQCGGECKCKNK